MIKVKHCKRIVLPSTEELGKAITDSITHEFTTETGKLRLKHVFSQLTDAEIDTSTYTTELALTREGPDGDDTLSLGAEDSTFTDNPKLVLSFTPLLSPLRHFPHDSLRSDQAGPG
jgi:hypothetical protein